MKFKYDIVTSLLYGVCIGVVCYILVNKAILEGWGATNKLLIFIDLIVGIGTLYFVYKVLIPALLGKVALELTEESIIDNINNLVIKWDNVKGIRNIKFNIAESGVAIDLFDNTKFDKQLNFVQKPFYYMTGIFYGTPLTIPFRYIAGDSSTIFLALQNYYRSKNNS